MGRGKFIQQAANHLDRAKALYEGAAKAAGKAPDRLEGAAAFRPAKDMQGLLAQAEEAGVRKDVESLGEDVVGLRSLVI
jgi:hydroxylamine reductase